MKWCVFCEVEVLNEGPSVCSMCNDYDGIEVVE
jgi:hypothetical protein